jgi:hypothetical protein
MQLRFRTWVTNAYRQPKVGTCFVHTEIDDHPAPRRRTATTTTPLLPRPGCLTAVAWFADRGVTVDRVLSEC